MNVEDLETSNNEQSEIPKNHSGSSVDSLEFLFPRWEGETVRAVNGSESA